MLTLEADDAAGLAVLVFSGVENTDADYARYIDVIGQLDDMGVRARAATGVRPAIVIVVDPENPTPNSAWRKKIADGSADLSSNPLLALVTASPLVRGVAAALNWLRPPPYTVKTFATFEGGVAWIESVRGPAPELVHLHNSLRASLGLAGAAVR